MFAQGKHLLSHDGDEAKTAGVIAKRNYELFLALVSLSIADKTAPSSNFNTFGHCQDK